MQAIDFSAPTLYTWTTKLRSQVYRQGSFFVFAIKEHSKFRTVAFYCHSSKTINFLTKRLIYNVDIGHLLDKSYLDHLRSVCHLSRLPCLCMIFECESSVLIVSKVTVISKDVNGQYENCLETRLPIYPEMSVSV